MVTSNNHFYFYQVRYQSAPGGGYSLGIPTSVIKICYLERPLVGRFF